MRLLILSTDNTLLGWDKLPTYKQAITSAVPRSTLSIQIVDTTPTVFTDGRISHVWLADLIRPYFNDGYDIVGFHMSDVDRRRFGIKPTLRGSNPRSGGEYGDFYFWADEDTLRNGLPQFVQTFLHELGHEFHQQTNTQDGVHLAHSANPDITKYIQSLAWETYQPERMLLKLQVSLWQRVLDLTKRLIQLQKPRKLIHPVDGFGVSQAYGVKNSRYPQTGHHIGTDYLTPKGTPVKAPADGKITTVGSTKVLGNYCHYEYQYNGQRYVDRYLHLRDKPKNGEYLQGAVLGYTGNTGDVTGYHLHIDTWIDGVNLEQVNPYNFRDLTVNPEKHYNQ